MEGAERVTARAQPDGMTSEHGLLRSRSACHLVITLRAAEMTKSYPRAPCPRLHPIPCRKGNPILMRTAILTIVLTAAAALTAGCHTNTVDTFAFKSALNTYYASHPDCLWNQPVKFPAQADSSDESQTKGFDALTDAGLMNRTPGEKQRFLIGSKRVNNYDLSDKGRSARVADPAEPGYGNFCLGTPQIKSIESYVPGNDSSASQYSVIYRYAVPPPSWANTSEMKTAFPLVARDSDGQEATATLAKSSNGWQVQNVSQPTQPSGQ
ncbi:conserved hypothetical protein [Candidatus Sulfotelmatomonas gaucii]|uniref:Uncharacterized protein n=1 Tax=Candidatus Sulfuritelmatomonas gaucii TaxID=2043161 RepID=A0A2N9L2E3_9BACT|nr:conserved hypothetical protein [Candidatus Sulfotelmatomonas gaucii]